VRGNADNAIDSVDVQAHDQDCGVRGQVDPEVAGATPIHARVVVAVVGLVDLGSATRSGSIGRLTPN
jgi:hypothetical protein